MSNHACSNDLKDLRLVPVNDEGVRLRKELGSTNKLYRWICDHPEEAPKLFMIACRFCIKRMNRLAKARRVM